jgi:hypothetical protein
VYPKVHLAHLHGACRRRLIAAERVCLTGRKLRQLVQIQIPRPGTLSQCYKINPILVTPNTVRHTFGKNAKLQHPVLSPATKIRTSAPPALECRTDLPQGGEEERRGLRSSSGGGALGNAGNARGDASPKPSPVIRPPPPPPLLF